MSARFIISYVNNSIRKVALDSIAYIESYNDHQLVFLANNEVLELPISMEAICQHLDSTKFIEIHDSYIVSVEHIYSIGNEKVFMRNMVIPIHKNYTSVVQAFRKRVERQLAEYMQVPSLDEMIRKTGV